MEHLLVFECHMAMGGIGTILSLLYCATGSHVVHRLHNEAGPWKPTDVVVSHPASGWQKSLLLEWCYNVFFVCGCGHEGQEEREQQREPTGFSVPWHVLIGRGVYLLMKCVGKFIQVHFRRQTTCVVPDVCVYLPPTSVICVHRLD